MLRNCGVLLLFMFLCFIKGLLFVMAAPFMLVAWGIEWFEEKIDPLALKYNPHDPDQCFWNEEETFCQKYWFRSKCVDK